ncbi:MAG: hypothetical protein TQ37_05845 [Candidatus Synechococcus spongiarum 15L]|uniref:Uncharacterized protein n=1 Tax=Candidatus Synechococcus spongiarum 15L TaxID=1608419 RepID=A0A0G8AVN7_9SYNE|nr:MAG: hypothetical protein TQ37_05845 [Candidatus Synechococcus spongiarum 15L]
MLFGVTYEVELAATGGSGTRPGATTITASPPEQACWTLQNLLHLLSGLQVTSSQVGSRRKQLCKLQFSPRREKSCYATATAWILLDDLTATNFSLLIGAMALALLFVSDGFPNDDDDDSSGGGLMQPVGATIRGLPTVP